MVVLYAPHHGAARLCCIAAWTLGVVHKRQTEWCRYVCSVTRLSGFPLRTRHERDVAAAASCHKYMCTYNVSMQLLAVAYRSMCITGLSCVDTAMSAHVHVQHVGCGGTV